MDCKICGNSLNNNIVVVREMMLGLGEEFSYLHCGKCECLHIIQPPTSMNKYYPDNYYSFSNTPSKVSKFKKYFTKQRDIYAINKSSFIGQLFHLFKPASSFIQILSFLSINKKTKILDIGSGNGVRIYPIANAGFNISGIDPYIERDIIHENGLKIYKKDIFSAEGSCDLIMMNHVFEHMIEPEKVLKKINSLLSPNGKCLIRIPIIPSQMWEQYKTDWVQIDAPRHFIIYSKKGIEILVNKTGFIVETVIYDSTPFQFMGSELYKRNIIMSEGDFRLDKRNRMFTKEEIRYYKKQTKILNEIKKGDQAAFILRKVDDLAYE